MYSVPQFVGQKLLMLHFLNFYMSILKEFPFQDDVKNQGKF